MIEDVTILEISGSSRQDSTFRTTNVSLIVIDYSDLSVANQVVNEVTVSTAGQAY